MTARAPVWAVGASADGKLIFAGDDTGRVYRYAPGGAGELKYIQDFNAHASRVWVVEVNPAGGRLLTAGMDRTARIWAVGTGPRDPDLPQAVGSVGGVYTDRPVRTLRGHVSDVVAAAFPTPDGRGPVVTCADSSLRLFDAGRDAEARVLTSGLKGPTGEPPAVRGLAFGPDGRTVAADAGRPTHRWDAATGRPVEGWPRQEDFQVNSLAFSPDGATVAEGAFGRVRVRPVAGGDGTTWAADPGTVAGCAFLPGGRLATLGTNGSLAVRDAATGSQVWATKAHQGPALGLAGSADGRTLATCGQDRLVKLWAAADGKPVRTLAGHTHHVNGVAFSPDGARVASAGFDNTTRVWDVAAGREVLRLHTRSHFVNGVAFSPDGRRLAEASGDGTVTIYDARTGQDAITLKGHVGEVRRVAFSPDGARLATVGDGGTVRLWDAPLDVTVVVPPGADEPFDPAGQAKGRK